MSAEMQSNVPQPGATPHPQHLEYPPTVKILVNGQPLLSQYPSMNIEQACAGTVPIDPLSGLSRLALDPNPQLLHLSLVLAGVHPDPQFARPLNDPFHHRQDSRVFTNVGEHLLAVQMIADALGAMLAEKGILSEEARAEARRRALWHDVGKAADIIVRDARNSGALPKDFSKHSRAEIRRVFEANVRENDPPQVWELIPVLAASGSETGHESVRKYLEVTSAGLLQLKAGMIIEKIVHLADLMVNTTISNDPNQRPQTLIVTPAQGYVQKDVRTRYKHIVEQGLGYLADTHEIVPILDLQRPPAGTIVLGCYCDLNLAMAEGICLELSQLLKLDQSLEPAEAIRSAVVSRLQRATEL